LQGIRSSSGLNKLKKIIEIGETWAREREKEVARFIEEAGNNIVITYSGLGYSPASILYWIITTAFPDKNTALFDSDTIAYYRLPYSKSSSIIHFSTRPDDPALIRLSDTSRWTNNRLLIITPEPPEVLKELLRGSPYIQTPSSSNEIITCFYESMLSLLVGVKIARSRGKRFIRLEKFIDEGYGPILDEFFERYRNVTSTITKYKSIIVSSTSLLEPHVHVLIQALRNIGIQASFIPITMLTPLSSENILIVATSIEENIVKEKKFKALMNNANVIDFTLNVDPLEAPIYIHLVSMSFLH